MTVPEPEEYQANQMDPDSEAEGVILEVREKLREVLHKLGTEFTYWSDEKTKLFDKWCFHMRGLLEVQGEIHSDLKLRLAVEGYEAAKRYEEANPGEATTQTEPTSITSTATDAQPTPPGATNPTSGEATSNPRPRQNPDHTNFGHACRSTQVQAGYHATIDRREQKGG